MQERVIDRVEVYKLGGDSFCILTAVKNTYCENKISKRKELNGNVLFERIVQRDQSYLCEEIYIYKYNNSISFFFFCPTLYNNISNFKSFLDFCCEIDEIILIRKTKQFHHDIRIASDVELLY